MTYDERQGERISKLLKEKHVGYETKNMIGGLRFMLNDKMIKWLWPLSTTHTFARIDPDIYQSSLNKKGCRPMDFIGRIIKGFVCVDPIGINSDKALEYRIQLYRL
jgi:hypothetical protein